MENNQLEQWADLKIRAFNPSAAATLIETLAIEIDLGLTAVVEQLQNNPDAEIMVEIQELLDLLRPEEGNRAIKLLAWLIGYEVKAVPEVLLSMTQEEEVDVSPTTDPTNGLIEI
jgi:hypothetical protein